MRKVNVFLRRYPMLWWLSVVVAASAAGFLVFTSISNTQASAARLGGLVEINVATTQLSPGQRIGPNDYKTEEWPRALLPQSRAVQRPEGSVVTVLVVPGMPLTENLMAATGISGPAALLRSDERGSSVVRNETTPSLSVGDWVDLHASPTNSTNEADVKTLATGARVIDVREDAFVVAASISETEAIAASRNLRITAVLTTPSARADTASGEAFGLTGK